MTEAPARTDAGQPGISMVLTCYNRGPFIRAAVRSCLQQDYCGPLELIIVDDCSTDNSPALILEELQETPARFPVRIINTPRNMGVAAATDAGWAAARHEWICMVDGDDIQCADRCSRLAALAKVHPEARFIEMSSVNIDENGTPFGYTNYSIAPYETAPEELLLAEADARSRNWLWLAEGQRLNAFGCSMAVHRSLFQKWGPLASAESQPFTQDQSWEFRAMLSAPALGSRQIAALYRSHGGNLQNRAWNLGGWRGLADMECFYSSHAAFLLSTVRHMQRDLDRALHTPGLTDWEPERLREAALRLEQEANGCLLRLDWWNIGWAARLWRCLAYRNKIPAAFRSWGWLRLLTLPLFCMAKWRKIRRRQGKEQ